MKTATTSPRDAARDEWVTSEAPKALRERQALARADLMRSLSARAEQLEAVLGPTRILEVIGEIEDVQHKLGVLLLGHGADLTMAETANDYMDRPDDDAEKRRISTRIAELCWTYPGRALAMIEADQDHSAMRIAQRAADMVIRGKDSILAAHRVLSALPPAPGPGHKADDESVPSAS